MDIGQVTVSVLCLISILSVPPATEAVNSLVSVPPSNDGLLVGNDGQQISLTCTHENTNSFSTRWVITGPVNCNRIVGHGSDSEGQCGPFIINDISAVSPFTSTAVANATTDMTGATVQCRDSAAPNANEANITLCIVDPLPAPANLSCSNITNGLLLTWDEVQDDSCANSTVIYYFVEISEANILRRAVDTSDNITGMLLPSRVYNISVRATNEAGVIAGEPSFIECETAGDLVPITTTTTTGEASSASSTIQMGTTTDNTDMVVGPPVEIIVPVLIVAIALIVAVIIGILLYCLIKHKKGKELLDPVFPGKSVDTGVSGEDNTDTNTDTKVDLATYADPNSIEHQQAPGGEEYAMVAKKKPEVLGALYQDPHTIQHQEAAGGDLYTVVDKPKKGSKKTKEPSDDPLAQMYSVPDKSRKNQDKLTYADIDLPRGGAVHPHQQTEYASLVD